MKIEKENKPEKELCSKLGYENSPSKIFLMSQATMKINYIPITKLNL